MNAVCPYSNNIPNVITTRTHVMSPYLLLLMIKKAGRKKKKLLDMQPNWMCGYLLYACTNYVQCT